MSQDRATPLPKGILIGAAILIFVTIATAAAGRLTGIGTTMTPDAGLVQSRSLHFADRTDGGVDVVDMINGSTVYIVPPGTNGFLRGVLRGMSRVRKLEGIGPEPGYILSQWADGRLSLADPATGREVNLEPFGPDNYGVFAKFLPARAAGK